jgi:hypothetical protein
MRRFWLSLAITGIATFAPAFVMAGDQEIAQQIAANLKTSGRMQGYNINVVVDDGTVQLNGSVRNAQQLEDALSIAEVTPGIQRVINNLEVKQAGKSTLQQPANLFANNANRNYPIQQTVATSSAGDSQPAIPQQMPVQVVQGPRAAGNAAPLAMRTASRQAVPTPAVPEAVQGSQGTPLPAHIPSPHASPAPAAYDSANMPNYAWPSYAAHPNYAAVTYPKQYSATAWPYIGPFYPYPQVPLGWRKVTLEWDDGWWQLDFKD